jgi:hypothetical protein
MYLPLVPLGDTDQPITVIARDYLFIYLFIVVLGNESKALDVQKLYHLNYITALLVLFCFGDRFSLISLPDWPQTCDLPISTS